MNTRKQRYVPVSFVAHFANAHSKLPVMLAAHTLGLIVGLAVGAAPAELGSIHNLPQSTILFEVSLPTTKWNGKYFVAGGGGYNGVIPRLTQALTEGYAAAGSDTGHEAKNTNWAINNLDAQNGIPMISTPPSPATR